MAIIAYKGLFQVTVSEKVDCFTIDHLNGIEEVRGSNPLGSTLKTESGDCSHGEHEDTEKNRFRAQCCQ